MYQDVMVLLRGDFSLEDVCRAVGKALRKEIPKIPDGVREAYHAICLGLDFTIYESTFVDDGNIPFSRYKYVVAIDIRQNAIEYEHWFPLMTLAARVVAWECHHTLNSESILVGGVEECLGAIPETEQADSSSLAND